MTAPPDTNAPCQPARTGLRRLTGAYRRMYCRLPPGVQLVGLQLWLPLVFIVLFCLCYRDRPQCSGLQAGGEADPPA